MVSEDLEFNYEEISPAEVDRVVAVLKQLEATVGSETIREFLEECSTNIHFLIYDDQSEGFDIAA